MSGPVQRKAERPARKVGHVTVLGDDMADVRRRAALAAQWLSEATWADGWSVHAGAAALQEGDIPPTGSQECHPAAGPTAKGA